MRIFSSEQPVVIMCMEVENAQRMKIVMAMVFVSRGNVYVVVGMYVRIVLNWLLISSKEVTVESNY